MRILCLDVGTKVTGLAVSDERNIIATAAGSVTGYATIPELSGKIAEQIKKLTPERVVIGKPVHMDGRESRFFEDIRALGDSLTGSTGLPVVYWDERLSTMGAEKSMLEGDLSRKKRKGRINTVAAQWILQGYLDYLNEGGR